MGWFELDRFRLPRLAAKETQCYEANNATNPDRFGASPAIFISNNHNFQPLEELRRVQPHIIKSFIAFGNDFFLINLTPTSPWSNKALPRGFRHLTSVPQTELAFIRMLSRNRF